MSALSQSLEDTLNANKEYVHSVRSELDSFLATHMHLAKCLEMQKRHISYDLLLNPINALWLLPYFSFKKVMEVSEKLGFDSFSKFGKKVPSSFRTQFQKELESLVASELFKTDNEALSKIANSAEELSQREKHELHAVIKKEISEEIKTYGSKQANISDLISTGATLLIARLMFKDSSLSALDIGRKIATGWQREKATNNFFLGKKVGHLFYRIAPVHATGWQIAMATVIVFAVISVATTALSMVFPVIQSKLGLQRKQLEGLISAVEERLTLRIAKEFQRAQEERKPIPIKMTV